jgi:membrane-bound inhibitor of C-type lysozyme
MSYFQTDPPSASMETQEGTSLLFQAASGSGARYVGIGVQYWEHQGAATITRDSTPGETTCHRES